MTPNHLVDIRAIGNSTLEDLSRPTTISCIEQVPLAEPLRKDFQQERKSILLLPKMCVSTIFEIKIIIL